MPNRQPFTTLCRQLSRPKNAGRSDLHVHSTHSDGEYRPAQVVELAARAGLAALAITDHDTVAGIAPAQGVKQTTVEVIAGVEISAEREGAELHLLGYFFRPEEPSLLAALDRLRRCREDRFREMRDRLRQNGVSLLDELPKGHPSLGRRHLALMLVKARRARTVPEAFARFLHDGSRAAVPLVRMPASEAITQVRAAGGVASWAHPPYDCTRKQVEELAHLGLHALEVDFPNCHPNRSRQLRDWARECGLAVSGGSDCHGPGPVSREIGSRGVTSMELDILRSLVEP